MRSPIPAEGPRHRWRERVAAAGIRGRGLVEPSAQTEAELRQPLTALQRANQLRLERSQLRRELAAGKITIREAVGHRSAKQATVVELLRALPRFGRTRAERYALECKIKRTQRCGALTRHQLLRLELRLAEAGVSSRGGGAKRNAAGATVAEAKAAAIAAEIDELGLVA
jgi:hypothetical protein